jgi:homocysteine S-methyltransferase
MTRPETKSLPATIRDRVVGLDGGLATELERQGHDVSSSLWSAALLVDNPQAILEAHRTFFAAGAEVATTASYQASEQGFASRGLDVAPLLRRSVELARQARDEHGHGWVAASVGPYGAARADGSEYRGDYGIGVAELRRFHRPRLEILAAAGADVLAVETIPCAAEVEALLAELDDLAFPAWLSLTAAGGRTRAGEPLGPVFAAIGDCSAVFAAGVNCLEPEDVTAAVEVAGRASSLPAVVYPNAGMAWDAHARSWAGRQCFEPSAVGAWIAAGARLVGGCCGVTPADIAAVAARIHAVPDGSTL